MECKVLRENNMLEVDVAIKLENKTVQSEKINFHDSLTFQVKHIRYTSASTYNNYNQRVHENQNIVLISITKRDKNDKSTYRIRLSCPELEVHESIFYSDESQWRVVSENKYTSEYKFKIILTVESVHHCNFSVLYEDEQLTDFKLKCQDGEIKIHKAFLAAVSTVFRSKLVNKNENIDFLEIPETSINTLIDFKKCIYTEVLPDKNLEELLLLATYFKIIWLQYKCIDVMLRDMSTGDAMELLEFSLTHRHMPLFLGIMDNVQGGSLKMSDIRKHYLQQRD